MTFVSKLTTTPDISIIIAWLIILALQQMGLLYVNI